MIDSALRRFVVTRMLAGVCLVFGVFLALPAAVSIAADDSNAARVLAVRLDGPVTPVMAEIVASAVEEAEAGGYAALVLGIDTPGGLVTSMRHIVKELFASEVPVISWVSPGGAQAASAGVFITMAADVAAMAPGTNMGAATPINMQGAMDSTLASKATNDAAAFARTIAAQRGRNVAWAEAAVRHADAVSETEAVDLNVVDFVAGTVEELLVKADGRSWSRGEDERTLEIAGFPVDWLELTFRQKLLGVIADPNIAYILMMLGFYGLLFELQNPGAILPGVVGGICIILAFLALSTLPVNYAGIALIALGIAFFIAEVKVVSNGVLAAGGVIALVLGSLILFRGEGVRVSWQVIAGATVATAGFFMFIAGAALRAQRRRVATGRKGLEGTTAVVVARLGPEGQVRVGDELWNAVAETDVEVGTEVEITGVDRLTLRVRLLAREA
jgi:membrane-bound serine protease (ClpP class)